MDSEPFAVLPFPEAFRIGNVFSMIVYYPDYEDIEYGYRMDGPFDPENGYRFDKKKFCLTPMPKLSRAGTNGEKKQIPKVIFGTEEGLARPLFKQKCGSRHKLYHLSRRIYSGRHGVITLGFMYAETVKDHGAERDCFIHCGVNTFWEERSLELPVLPEKMKWYKTAYTYGDNRKEEK